MNLSMKELRELNKKEYYSKFQEKMHSWMLYVTWPLLLLGLTAWSWGFMKEALKRKKSPN